jgi:hypothetical protein
VRHRESQTLYVSDLIEPPTCKDPGYGKLQVGIYVAAIQDMMDRTKQRLRKSQPKSPDGDTDDNPAGGDDDDKDDRDDDWGSGSGHKGDQGNSKGRTGGGGHGNPSGGVRKSGRFQGGAGRKDPGVISSPDKYRQLLLGFRMGVYRPMLEKYKIYR